jgi:hypothetical protein
MLISQKQYIESIVDHQPNNSNIVTCETIFRPTAHSLYKRQCTYYNMRARYYKRVLHRINALGQSQLTLHPTHAQRKGRQSNCDISKSHKLIASQRDYSTLSLRATIKFSTPKQRTRAFSHVRFEICVLGQNETRERCVRLLQEFDGHHLRSRWAMKLTIFVSTR